MSASVNTAIIVGNLGRAPELKATPAGKQVCNFSVATSKGKGDSQKTEWHHVVAWDQLATQCAEYLTKGSSVYVEGELRTRQWEKDGVKHSKTEIHAHSVQFLSPKGGNNASTDR
jgi:single-strand DNA-binding protein